MKADMYGTRVEQARHAMGWKTATQLRIAGVGHRRRCAGCEHHYFKTRDRADGGVLVSLWCGHRDAGGKEGHATRESAGCDRWEPMQ